MGGIRTGTRREQLESLRRRTQHQIAATLRSDDRSGLLRLTSLAQRLDEEIVAEGGKATPKPKVTKRAKPVPGQDMRLLAELGVSVHDVRVWAVAQGLLAQGTRGRIKRDLVQAYADHHDINGSRPTS